MHIWVLVSATGSASNFINGILAIISWCLQAGIGSSFTLGVRYSTVTTVPLEYKLLAGWLFISLCTWQASLTRLSVIELDTLYSILECNDYCCQAHLLTRYPMRWLSETHPSHSISWCFIFSCLSCEDPTCSSPPHVSLRLTSPCTTCPSAPHVPLHNMSLCTTCP